MAIKQRNDSLCKQRGAEGFIEAGPVLTALLRLLPTCNLAHRLQLRGEQEHAGIGISLLWWEHGNHVINCSQISLMDSRVVIS